jgi:hypothetical protein
MKNNLLLLLLLLFSCKIKTKEVEKHQSDLSNWIFESNYIKSKKGIKKFHINLSNELIKKDEINFHKFYLESFKDKSLFLGIRNDTVFCYEAKTNFYDVFLILDKKKTTYLSFLGNDYRCELVKTEELKNRENIYHYNFHFIKTDFDVVSNIIYPDFIFKGFVISNEIGFKKIELLDMKTNLSYEVLWE